VDDAGDTITIAATGGGGASDAADVTFDPTGLDNTTATDVQAALEDFDVAITAGGGGGGVATLDDLSDVDLTTNTPSDGDTLVYDAGVSKWVPGAASGAGEYDWCYQPYPQRLTSHPVETRTAGTYTYTPDSTITGGGFIYNNSHAQNDALEFSVWLGAGTYALYLVTSTDNNRGIMTWAIDDGAGTYTTLGTLDMYVASGGVNDVNKSITGWTLTGSPVRRKLRCKVATKNASSSDYYFAVQQVQIVRTA
jgi:hypothetical protein